MEVFEGSAFLFLFAGCFACDHIFEALFYRTEYLIVFVHSAIRQKFMTI